MLSPKEAMEFRDNLAAKLRMHADKIAALDGIDRRKPHEIAAAISHASLVLWAEEMQAAANAGSEHFVGLEWNPGTLCPPTQLWVLPRQRRVREEEAGWFLFQNNYRLSSVLISSDLDDHLGCIFILVSDFGVSKEYPPMMRVYDLIGPISESTSHIASMCGFMALDIVELERLRMSGAQVRDIHSKGCKPPDIRVVVLRRKKFASTGDPQSSIEWSCRWVVSGHWRRQWCPSINGHRPVFIEGYVKGPESKPLKAHTAERMYAVVR